MPTFRVGKPRLGLRRATNQVTIGGSADIVWTTAVYQDPVFWTVATPVEITVPKTGLWLAVFSVARLSVASSDFVNARLFLNGSTILATRQSPSTDALGCQVVMLRELQVNDVLKCNFESNNATTLVSTRLTFDLTRIGPDRWTG